LSFQPGIAFNLDGSTLYLSLAAMFVAQAAGVSDALGNSDSYACYAHAHEQRRCRRFRGLRWVILAGTLGDTYGLPLEGVAVILGVDEILDMGRTAVNLVGIASRRQLLVVFEGVDSNRFARRAGPQPF